MVQIVHHLLDYGAGVELLQSMSTPQELQYACKSHHHNTLHMQNDNTQKDTIRIQTFIL